MTDTKAPDLNVNSTAVREFINRNTTRPCPASEFMEFWKACSTEERQQFGSEARTFLAA